MPAAGPSTAPKGVKRKRTNGLSQPAQPSEIRLSELAIHDSGEESAAASDDGESDEEFLPEIDEGLDDEEDEPESGDDDDDAGSSSASYLIDDSDFADEVESEDSKEKDSEPEISTGPKSKTIISKITGRPKRVFPEIEPDYDSDSSTEDVGPIFYIMVRV